MRVLVLAVASLLAGGCGAVQDASPREPPRAAGHGNFTLYVSNQSFERADVDIRVEIDGERVVDDQFSVENQHNWVDFRLPLRGGKHVLRATSTSGDAALERVFHTRGRRWAVLDYWCCDDADDPRFTFLISKRPLAFG